MTQKAKNIISFFSFLIALSFIFSAFRGFHFWYGGFVFFLWLSLSVINYEQKTSLWLLIKRIHIFVVFWLSLSIISFLLDYFIGQKMTALWVYPYYDSLADWLRLWMILYPFGGLAVLELTYFLSSIFGEQLEFIKTRSSAWHKAIDKLDLILLATVFILPFVFFKFIDQDNLNSLIIILFVGWAIVATIKLRFHINHWRHFVFILALTLLLSVLLHEVPNVGVFEWQYSAAPFLNQEIIGVKLWVMLSWYFLVLAIFRIWIYWILHKKQD